MAANLSKDEKAEEKTNNMITNGSLTKWPTPKQVTIQRCLEWFSSLYIG